MTAAKATAKESAGAKVGGTKAAAKVLAAHVYVDGIGYPAGSTPPAEVAEKITNPNAWAKPEA